MAKYYSTKINSRYVAKVMNDPSKDCSLDEQVYDQYYDEIKAIIKTISTNLDNITRAVAKLEDHPKTGKASATYCKKITEESKKIKQELALDRNNLSKKLDAEFKSQIKAWIAWTKKQATK